MFKKLKSKFTILATVSMFVLMAVLVSIMNIVNYSSVVSDSDSILSAIDSASPPFKGDFGFFDSFEDRFFDLLPRGMSPEVPYESRYFTALIASDGTVFELDTARTISVTQETALEYLTAAFSSGTKTGFVGSYRYLKESYGDFTRCIFLDCSRTLGSFRTFLKVSIITGLLGCAVIFALFFFASGKILRPISESYEKQKRFITDAGHEIKTPLTIINANVDLLEDDLGGNENLDDIKQQTQRLTELTGELVYLSKMEESENSIQKIEFPVSDLISETADDFQVLAVSGNIAYTVSVQPGVSMNGSPDAIQRLTSVLLDNAFKYVPSGGSVALNMSVSRKALTLSVSNTSAEMLDAKTLSHLFDRFYRADASRNSRTGGHGIGLSIAQAITRSHGGKISAEMKDNETFLITVVLPV